LTVAEIAFVLDKSISMRPMKDEAIGSLNGFVDDQKALPGEARMTLTQFSTFCEINYVSKPIKQCPHLNDHTYVPQGMTALYDAIGQTVDEMASRINGMPTEPDKKIVVILTDGEENSSKEYNIHRLKMLIERKVLEGWEFIFLAQNLTMSAAQATARQMGIDDTSKNCFVSAVKKGKDGLVAGTRGASHAVASSRTQGFIDKTGTRKVIDGIVPVDEDGLAKEADAPPPLIKAKSRPLAAAKKKPKKRGFKKPKKKKS